MNRRVVCFILISFILFQSMHVFSQGSWNKMNTSCSKALWSVCFTDSAYGWAAGDDGSIIHTADGGKTWVKQESHTQNQITSITFINRNLGWASSCNYSTVPAGTVLLKTTNGGTTWTSHAYAEENVFISCVTFLDSLNGWIGGSPHVLSKTSDGGMTWQPAYVEPSPLSQFPVLKIKFFNRTYGYACGGIFDVAGVIWRTTDGGNSWRAIDPACAPADEVLDLHISDSLKVIGVGGDPDYEFGVGMMRSTGDDLNFIYREQGFKGRANCIVFADENEAWCSLGERNMFLYSRDGGSSWSEMSTPSQTFVTSLSFPDSRHGYASGRKGEILKYTQSSNGIQPVGNGSTDDKLSLHEIYPNPIKISAEIRFHVPKSVENDVIRIRICDILGREVASVINQAMSPGEHEVNFNPEGLPAGVYFCSLTAPSFPASTMRLVIGK